MVAIHSYWDERKLLVFVTLIIIACAAMLLELDASRHGRQSPIDELIAGVLTPIEGAITAAGDALSTEAQTLAQANEFAARDRELKQKVRGLAAANERLRADAAENRRLRRMLGMEQALPRSSGVAADVVGFAPEAARKEIAIDRGWRDGIRADDVVVSGDGLVGHVIDAARHDAHVLLVTDPASSVPAYLSRTQTWGIVTGTSLHAHMKYISQDANVLVGDPVVTGRGEVYPGGIPIGRVMEVDRKDNALYQTAVLQPAVDFSTLTHVIVLRKR